MTERRRWFYLLPVCLLKGSGALLLVSLNPSPSLSLSVGAGVICVDDSPARLSVQLSVCVYTCLFLRVAVTKSDVLMEDCYDQNKSIACTLITPRLSGGTVAATFAAFAAHETQYSELFCAFISILFFIFALESKKNVWVHQALKSIMFCQCEYIVFNNILYNSI